MHISRLSHNHHHLKASVYPLQCLGTGKKGYPMAFEKSACLDLAIPMRAKRGKLRGIGPLSL